MKEKTTHFVNFHIPLTFTNIHTHISSNFTATNQTIQNYSHLLKKTHYQLLNLKIITHLYILHPLIYSIYHIQVDSYSDISNFTLFYKSNFLTNKI